MTADSLLSWDELDKGLGATMLSTTGPRLPGLLVKRTVFEGSTDMVDPPPADTNALVVHNNGPVELRWRVGRRVDRRLVFPGQVIVLPAGYIEGRAWDKRTEDVRVGLAPDSVYLGSSRATLRPAIGVHDPLLGQLGTHLARTFESGAAADSLYADALAHALGAHLVEHYSDRPIPQRDAGPDCLSQHQLGPVYDYIESNLGQALTVTELAGVIGASPTHFARLFRQATGDSPYHYVRSRRLERAERLIASTQLSLASIAVAVGFSDQSHLNRVMRAERDVTPGQLRRSLA
jgi:AraC family transcriptional regulator